MDDESGKPLPDARVVVFTWPISAMGESTVLDQTKTVRFDLRPSDTGRFECNLPDEWKRGGFVIVVAQAVGHAEYRSGERAAGTKFDADAVVEVPVRLKKGRTLRGTVHDASGRPIAGARVHMTLSGPNWCSWPHSFRAGSFEWPSDIVTDEHGDWEMLGFPHEEAEARGQGARWVLQVFHDRYTPAVVQSIEKIEARNGVVEITTTLNAGESARGRVVGPTGEPVSGAEVTATGSPRPDEPVCMRVEKRSHSGTDGTYTLNGLDARTWEVRARAAGFGPTASISLATAALATKPLTLSLKKGYEVTGRLLDDTGEPVANIEIRFTSRPWFYFDTTKTNQDGSFRFGGVPQGQATLTCSTLFERELRVPCPFQEVKLPPQRELVVRMTDRRGRPIAPPADVVFYGPGFSSRKSLASSDGRVSLGKLLPGSYDIRVESPGLAQPRRKVELMPGSKDLVEVTVEVPAGFALKGVVRDPSGHPLSGVRLKAWGHNGDQHEATSDAGGAFALRGLDTSWFGAAYAMCAEADGFAPWTDGRLFAPLNFDRTVDIELGRGTTVHGRVTHPDGKPAAGTLVQVSWARKFLHTSFRAPCSTLSTTTDAEGRYVLEHVPNDGTLLVRGAIAKSLEGAEGATIQLDWVQP